MSPEALQRGKYSPGSDIWALACSAVEMASGRVPWSELPVEQQQPMALMFHIGTAQPPDHHPQMPPVLSAELRGILSKCFEKAAENRPLPTALLALPYFKAGSGLPADAEPLPDYQAALALRPEEGGSSSEDGSSGLSYTAVSL